MNGAQIAIDTFVSSSETKWLRSTGLVLLLPHGFDGAGPDHSSCRVERFLQMVNSQSLAGSHARCLDSSSAPGMPMDKALHEAVNMRIAAPTTPANYFHLLRRQTSGTFRKPLVVVGPKTLLRHKSCVSSLNDMSEGTSFQPVLVSPAPGAGALPAASSSEEKAGDATRIILCSGKIALELEARRQELADKHPGGSASQTAIVRIEELAPWPKGGLNEALSLLSGGQAIKSVRFVQEEPANAGTWLWAKAHCEDDVLEATGCKLEYVGRPALAAPAVGVSHLHKAQVQRLFHFAFEE